MFSRSDVGRTSLILEIQAAAIEADVDVAALLRKAKVAAQKLKQTDALTWMNSELDGYTCSYDELPDFRKTHGILKAFNPYHGLVPIIIQDENTDEVLTRAPTYQGVGSLQSLLKKGESGAYLTHTLSAFHRNTIMDLLKVRLEPKLIVSYSQIEIILSRVVSLVLDWTLELEQAGILGEGMSFSMEDKQKATPITQNIFAQNIAQVGHNSDHVTSRISQEITGAQNIDQRKLSDFIEQAKQAAPLLPDDLELKTLEVLEQLEDESIDELKRSKLSSLRTILEGATGSVAAQGIIQLIAALL